MEIFVAEHRGFCYGVKRAVNMAQKSVGSSKKIRTLGPIIHNPQVVQHLESCGVYVADDLSAIEEGTVIIRSHGVSPKIYQEAQEKKLTILDATCPHVKKAQQAARMLLEQGYDVIVVGERHHPEVKSIVAWTDNRALAIESVAEAEQISFSERLGIVAQTTFARELFEKITEKLKTKCNEIKVEHTICNATEVRQQAAIELAGKVNVMLVIGGKNSANTTRLAELCHNTGCSVYHIETAAEIDPTWFYYASKVGITAGASTPDWIIEEVLQKMQDIDQMLQQQPAEIHSGEIIKGKIVGVRQNEVFVDIGHKAEGIIPLNELVYPIPDTAADVVSEGQVIDVYVLDADDSEGNIKLSKVKAERIIAWTTLESAVQTGETVEGKVTEVVKGGIVVAVSGLRGFIPASLVDIKYTEDLSQYIGQIVTLKPIEVDKANNKLVLSRKAVLEEQKRLREEKLFSQLKENQVLEGTVKRIAQFGAFVDIGGIDGLVHISDLSWERVKSPTDVVSVGDHVSVVVLKVDAKNGKLSLGLKQATRDPWFEAVEDLVVGAVLKGRVSKIAKFGAFVQIKKGVDGLVHLGELAEHRVSNPSEIVSVGQEVHVKVLSVDKQNKRIALSIAKAQADLERAEYQKFIGTNEEGFGTTIGEKFGHLFKLED